MTKDGNRCTPVGEEVTPFWKKKLQEWEGVGGLGAREKIVAALAPHVDSLSV